MMLLLFFVESLYNLDLRVYLDDYLTERQVKDRNEDADDYEREGKKHQHS